jgi:hypothetical protein
MYVDNKKPLPDGGEKFTFAPTTPYTLDFNKRDQFCEMIYQHGPPCDMVLNLEMDDSVNFEIERKSLRVADWWKVLLDPSSEYGQSSSSRPMPLATRGPAPVYTP